MTNTKKITILLLLILQIFNINANLQSSSDDDDDETYTFSIELKELYDKSNLVKDTNSVEFDDSVTQKQVVEEMGMGWNLGNTLDSWKDYDPAINQGVSTETCWGNVETTEAMFLMLKAKGFKSVRIPVTWHNHLIDNNYTVDPEWMSRVKTVVDWALNAGLYVILNTHHDNSNPSSTEIVYGKGYFPLNIHKKESERFLYNIWKQISIAFNNGYDHHLVFECMNEPRDIGSEKEWMFTKGDAECEESSSVNNEFLRLIVKVIRESGGNNEKRFVLVTPIAAAYQAAINSDFIIPGDKKYNPTNNKILISVHMYIPYNFISYDNSDYYIFEDSYKTDLIGTFSSLYEKFTVKGHYVVIGEMAADQKHDNLAERIKWAKFYVENARKFHMSSFYWDNADFGYHYTGLFHRDTLTFEYEELVDTLLNAAKTKFEENPKASDGKELLDGPVALNDWKNNIQVGAGSLSSMNSFNKFCFKTDEAPFVAVYRGMMIDYGDWSGVLIPEIIEGADCDMSNGGISLPNPKTTVEITFPSDTLKIAKQKGIILLGHGFNITSIYISGPSFESFEPKSLTASDKTQKVTFTFSENAEKLAGNIIFSNLYHDLNENVKCELDKSNEKVIICEGLFDFTGDYELTDPNGILLTNSLFSIVPKPGEEYSINNLIDTRVIFDDVDLLLTIKISSKKLGKVTKNSVLTIETQDLNIVPDSEFLFVHKGNTEEKFEFNEEDVNVKVNTDKSLNVPSGKQVIKIKLTNVYDEIAEKGFTIRGFGFGVNTVFIADN